MERVRIAALFADKEQYGGASVTVCGWAKTIRDMKTFGFIELNDGSCFRNLQVVMDANSLSNYKEIAAQNVGAALIVRGTVVLTPEAKQPLEVKATEIEVEGVSSCCASVTMNWWSSCGKENGKRKLPQQRGGIERLPASAV